MKRNTAIWTYRLWFLGVGWVFFFSARVGWGFLPPERAPLPDFDRRETAVVQPVVSPEQQLAVLRLKARLPQVQVDFDRFTGSPRSIWAGNGFLSGTNGRGGAIPAGTAKVFAAGDPHRATKAFLLEYPDLFRHGPEVFSQARVKRQFTTVRSGLSTTVWQQEAEGIEVLDAVLISHVSRRGELVAVSSQFLPDVPGAVERGGQSRTNLAGALKVSARRAIVIAAGQVEEGVLEEQVKPALTGGTNSTPVGPARRQEFQAPGLKGTATVQLTWLPLNAQKLRLCWDVILTSRTRGEMYRVLVDAGTGEPLVRRCLTEYVSTGGDATYHVFASDSPSPFSPGYATPTSAQPPLASRTLVTFSALDTNASPAGWIGDGYNETLGNNVDAHTDLNGDDQPDLPRPQGSPYRVFDFPLDLSAGPAAYRAAAVVQLFYWCNWMHDQLYGLGFTEAAGNFQSDNFGRGGHGNDAIQADAQDGGGFNNANFSTPPDGSPGRIQVFLFTCSTPARDADLDAEIILHECTHGLSNRRVGGGVGIFALQSAGMGEGWSDFYALALLSEPGDDVDGVYACGAYSSYQFYGLSQNYYFGIRRYPYSTDLGKNPLTFKDIDPAQASAHAGVPRSPIIGSTANEVHNMGEVWCVTLWEARANLIRKYGWAAGNRLILQLVTDGMNLSPPNPTFLQARDAILLADRLDSDGANQNELWNAFAKRGMGAYATCPGSFMTAGVHESYEILDSLQVFPNTGPAFACQSGQPVKPSCQSYFLSNIGNTDVVWTAVATQPWLAVAPAGGELAPGETNVITVCLASNASDLASGSYPAGMVFSNATTGVTHVLSASLDVSLPRILFFALDEDPGWSRDGEWQFGQPAGKGGADNGNPDPVAGATGTNVLGVNLNGDYPLQTAGPVYLTAGPFDFSGYTDLNVAFQRWLNTDYQPYVFATFEVSSDGTNWNRVWSNDAGEITDAGWRPVSCDISALADDQPGVYVRWGHQVASVLALAYSGWNLDDIEFVGNHSRQLAVSIPPMTAEGAGVLAGTIAALPPPATDLVVNLSSSDTNAIAVPALVVIPAGQSNVVFEFTVAAGGLPGTQTVQIRAAASHYVTATAGILVLGGADARLTVTLPASVWENAGVLTNAGWVSLARALPVDLLVSLASSAPESLTVAPMVTIPAGQTEASFDLEVVDNSIAEGNRLLTVQAGAPDFADGSATVSILDDETPPVPLNPAPANLAVNVNQACSLVWESGFLPGAGITNDIYFGTDPVPGPDQFIGSTTNQSWALPVLLPATIYYWRVVARCVGVTPGSVWRFTTRGVDHFSWDAIASPELVNQPFSVRVTARDAYGAVVSNFTGVVSLRGPPVVFSPTSSGPFANGLWEGAVNLEHAAANVVLVADDGAGHTGESGAFDVGEPATVLIQPTNRMAAVGAEAQFEVVAEGTAPLTCQWSFNGTNLVDATNSLLLIANVQFSDAGSYAVTVANAFGSETSSNAELIVGEAAAITTPPTNQVVAAGGVARFGVDAAGTPPLSYQWMFNGTNLPDATNNELLIWNAQAGDIGDYAVIVANAFGTVLSSNAELVLGAPPSLIVQPTNQFAAVGGTVRFEAAADGTPPLSYQWTFNGTNLLDATNRDLAVLNVQTNDAGSYAVAVANAFGLNTSSNAELVVGFRPWVVAEPAGLTVLAGAAAQFEVAADGTFPLNYQWTFNGTNLADATNSLLLVANVRPGDAGSYAVTVANAFGSASSSNAELMVGEPVVITAQPTNRLAAVGTVAWFEVEGAGTPPLSCQWSLNGTNLLDATNSLLLITNVQFSDAGSYAVTVANAFGSETSSNAELIVGEPATVVVQPSDQTVMVGAEARFQVTAEGAPPLNYQWTFNGTNLPEATNSELLLPDVQLADAGSYAATVANAFGSATSSNAELVVGEPAMIAVQPTNRLAAVGTEASFEVVAGGTLPLNCQWTFNGTNRVDATNSVLLFTNAQLSDAGSYAVTVANAFGSETSSNAELIVGEAATITAQPTNRAVAVGGAVRFEIEAAGTPPLNYQWAFNGMNLLDATNSELLIPSAQLTDAGNYAVQVANAFGSETSSTAELLVEAPATVVVQPTNRLAAVGEEVTFEVVAEGTLPLSYQWNLNGTNRLDATNSLLSITNVQFSDAGTYAVMVANAFGSETSSNADLVVGEPATVVGQPARQIVALDTAARFEVAAGGTLPLNYQWTFNGANLAEATNSELLIPNVRLADVGSYAVIVANAFGSETSSNAELVLGIPPAVIVQPTNRSVAVGSTARFGVVADGLPAPDYQWAFNGTNLPEATNSELVILNARTNDAGIYSVTMMNVFGSATSSNAELVVGEPATVSVQPAGRTAVVGAEARFQVTAEGTPPLSFQWMFNGTNLVEATNNELLLPDVQLANAGSYAVTVANAFGSMTSSNAELVVGEPATIVVQPTNLIAAVGATVQFEVAAHGTAPLGWQWTFNGTNRVDATNSVLLFTNAQLSDAGSYAVTVANAFGVETSSNAELIVGEAATITAQPMNQAVAVGGAVRFEIEAAGTPPLNCQWSCNGTNLAEATNNELLMANVQLSDAGSYAATVANVFGSEISSNAELVVGEPATIVVQPTNLVVAVGATAQFEAAAHGTAPLGWQWTFNGTNLLEATNSTLLLTNVQWSDAGSYAVTVANAFGSEVSSNAGLTVDLPPSVIGQPSDQTLPGGAAAVFSVVADGTPPLAYQWQRNGTPLSDDEKITGAFSNILSVSNLASTDGGAYSVQVSNPVGTAVSSNALLVVFVLDHFVWDPIPSPQFVNVPFPVSLRAVDDTNGVLVPFAGAVGLAAVPAAAFEPAASGDFVQGRWAGSVTVSQPVSGLVLSASDGPGHAGYANAINVIDLPFLSLQPSDATLLISWPAAASGFVLETTTNLAAPAWKPATGTLHLFADHYTMRVRINATNAFYRLRFTGP